MVLIPARAGSRALSGLTVVPPVTAGCLLRVTGTVQGVGFRPFVHQLARKHGLAGWIRNRSGDVEIRLEGSPSDIESFVERLGRQAPPLARVSRVVRTPVEPRGLSDFVIRHSHPVAGERQAIAPDVSICQQCDQELRDPANRRHRHPFITCTDCGPRISIIEDIPYDRSTTTMGRLPQCPSCLGEYREPGNRRFHSQTNSCPDCGPILHWEGPNGNNVCGNEAALESAVTALTAGLVVAVRGVGGYHLAVDALNEHAVATLRHRKRRNEKPFAVMVPDLAAAQALALLTDQESALLQARERPIVVTIRRPEAAIAGAIAPGLATLGLMLPYSPLHRLLLEGTNRPLVMTSANLSEEPLVADTDEARERLASLADGFLHHDRDISNRHDDSVARVTGDGCRIVLRRARGYAPAPLALPRPTPEPLVAVGPDLKNTFTLAAGDRAFVSQHLGDMENLATLEHWLRTLDRYRRLFRVEQPAVVVRDMHPGYLSSRIAGELGLSRVLEVQHHHAHIAAVMAEHQRVEPVIGVAYDGTGYGTDGTIWGAEVMVADLRSYHRVGHLKPAPLPGGDTASRMPWRSAMGFAFAAGRPGGLFEPADAAREAELSLVTRQLERGLNTPLASSMGRLFDAAASVIGLRHYCSFEGQAAQELEEAAGTRAGLKLPVTVVRQCSPATGGNADGTGWQWDAWPMLFELDRMARQGIDRRDLAAAFHDAVAEATLRLVLLAREETGLTTAALAGGSFQNARLHRTVRSRLGDAGFEVLTPIELSPNDGAISYGQAAVGAALLQEESPSCV